MKCSIFKLGMILLVLLFLGSSGAIDLRVHATEVSPAAPKGTLQHEQKAPDKPAPLSPPASDRQRFTDHLQGFSKIWHLKVFVIDTQPVTIGKLIFAL